MRKIFFFWNSRAWVHHILRSPIHDHSSRLKEMLQNKEIKKCPFIFILFYILKCLICTNCHFTMTEKLQLLLLSLTFLLYDIEIIMIGIRMHCNPCHAFQFAFKLINEKIVQLIAWNRYLKWWWGYNKWLELSEQVCLLW